MQEDPPRDTEERNIRIVCGGVLGLFIAGVIGFNTDPSWTAWALLCAICAAVCA